VDNYRHFQTLAEDYVTLSDAITRIESQDPSIKKTPAPRTRRRAFQGNRGFPETGAPGYGSQRNSQL
jgi:hypothetical protein